MLEFPKQHEFLVGIDSDGCAFDTMEVKHKECFIPNTIFAYNLQGISRYAREAAEFVNLYSKSRGINRFPALIETFHWLRKRPEVRARGVEVKIPDGLVRWMERETKLANPALAAAATATGDPDLKQALEWSQAVNDSVAKMVHGVPPFPYLRESLEKLADRADMVVVSATPHEALVREWEEHRLDKFLRAIGGQEKGTKKEMLGIARNYPPGQSLMIGDAPGDHAAAEANRALFFPINPGAEEASWRRFFEQGIDRFLAGTFAGEYQQQLLDDFHRYLPDRPPWPIVES
jgi:phosphoglycolate phosphatase-like HAD superfamily hydrolase